MNKLLTSRILFVVVSVFAFTACKTSKPLVNKPFVDAPLVKPIATDASPYTEVFKMLSDNAFKFQWLNARMEATIEIDKEIHNVNAQIRMRQDSVMWISVTAMGFEVARAIVTKDTVKMFDRFHSRYGIKDYGYLNEILNIALDFPMIQAVLTGNYVPYIDVQKLKSAKEEKDHYVLSTLSRRKSRKAGLDWEPVKVQLQIQKMDNHIIRMYIDDKEAKKEVDITYDDFRVVNGASFPYKITFKTERKSPVKIEIQYSKVNADMPQEFPFTIPRSFERIK